MSGLVEEIHDNMFSLHSPSLSELRCKSTTEFTFCNVLDVNDNKILDINQTPSLFSPSFGPKSIYSGHNCSAPSTEARNKILEEMMNNLPESCHELSLKDIVQDDVGNLRPLVEQETSVLKTGTGFKSKKLIDRKRPISRSVSLDTGVFMLKMFIPSSFSKKKSKSSPKMYSNNDSFSNNNINGSNCKSDKKCMSTNTKSRSAELAPGCWFINKPWKTNTGVSRGRSTYKSGSLEAFCYGRSCYLVFLKVLINTLLAEAMLQRVLSLLVDVH
uniref:Uncharacterized protein n=1 Tax=Tanacetum cinerariifolium TaxID=118510 RepID=A0A6L2K1J4_TANCI|nr:hypothetical protein [Tanacetum cinerariifolium]